MKTPPGADWSVGLNTQSSLSDALVLSTLGQGLREIYSDLVDEAVPDHFADLIERLEVSEKTSHR